MCATATVKNKVREPREGEKRGESGPSLLLFHSHFHFFLVIHSGKKKEKKKKKENYHMPVQPTG